MLTVILKSAPLTRSVGTALKEGYDKEAIYEAATSMGYTRTAVSYALRRHGIRQRRERTPRQPRTKRTDRTVRAARTVRTARAPRTPRNS